MIEPLESRIAPASVLTFTDVDGDKVTITASQGDLTGAGIATVVDGQLQLLHLTDPAFNGADITFSVVKAPGGDGLANVGRIDGGLNDLGAVVVKGDLAQIDTGSGTSGATALASLEARSMGLHGLATQGGTGDLKSTIAGTLGGLKVGGDVKDALIRVDGGDIGPVTIGGSLIGGVAQLSGAIFAQGGEIGPVTIGGDVIGGSGIQAGHIFCGRIVSITVGGSVIGGTANESGSFSASDVGPVTIARDLIGGTAANSGKVSSEGKMASVTIGGSIYGGGGGSGRLVSESDMGAITIGGDVFGGRQNSGVIESGRKIASVSIGGSLWGGPGNTSGRIDSSDDLGPVTIGGDVFGGSGASSGAIISFGAIASLTIGGSLAGGAGRSSGYLFSDDDIGAVIIGRDLRGGSISANDPDLIETGYIEADRVASVTIGGSVIAGINDSSSSSALLRNASIRVNDDLGPVIIGGSIIGNAETPVIISARGEGVPAGADVAIASITVGGRVERALILGGVDTDLASQNPNAQIGSVAVGKDWIASDLIANTKIASVTIGGVLIGTQNSIDGFRIDSLEIGSFQSTGATLALTPGPSNDPLVNFSPTTAGDVFVLERNAPAPPPPPAIPASLKIVNDHTATYSDIDGDKVTVTVSAGELSSGLFLFIQKGSAEQLASLDLRASGFAGANVTFSAARASGGDGLVNVGFIEASGQDLGKVKIAGDLGRILAGDADTNTAGLKLLSVRSMGAYATATQASAGTLEAVVEGPFNRLKVSGDIRGLQVSARASEPEDGRVGRVTVSGSLLGSDFFSAGDMGSVTIAGDVIGGPTLAINSNGRLGSLRIGGSVIGGAEQSSGAIQAADFGSIKIGGDLRGGEGDAAASIFASGNLERLRVGGSIIGGSGDTRFPLSPFGVVEGQVIAFENIGSVKIGGSVIGGAGHGSGEIRSYGATSAVVIGGSLVGGAGDGSGQVASEGAHGPVKIGRDVLGGSALFSGRIFATDDLARVKIGGSLVGGSNLSSGLVFSKGDIGPVKIGHDLRGGSISGTDPSLDSTGYIQGEGIASVAIGGSIVAGFDSSTNGALTRSGSIRAEDAIGTIKIAGSLIGHATADASTPVIISARGQAAPFAGTNDVAIASLTVGGRVEMAQVLAGFAASFNPGNGNASIGKVKVAGDWIASSISAGVTDVGGNGFGTADDERFAGATLVSRIASIKIKGLVIGTGSPASDHFGFTAGHIGKFKSLGFTAPLSGGAIDVIELSPATDDVTIREVA